MQLRRDLPAHAGGLLEADGHRPIVEPVRPHDRRRHVDVRVRGVDGEVGAIHAVAEHLVLHGDAAAVSRHVPPVRVRPCRRQLAAVGREGVDVVHVLGEVVERVASRRRAAHPQLERPVADVRKRRLDLHPAVLRLGERERVSHRRGGVKRHGRGDEKDGDEEASHEADANTLGCGSSDRHGSGRSAKAQPSVGLRRRLKARVPDTAR